MGLAAGQNQLFEVDLHTGEAHTVAPVRHFLVLLACIVYSALLCRVSLTRTAWQSVRLTERRSWEKLDRPTRFLRSSERELL